MQKPAIPEDEQARLEALYALNILDTPADERFDRLTRMAKRMFGVSIALVSLIDEKRQWFKSNVGLDASETSRDISFCGHAILGDDVFIVPNVFEDERFVDNPLVMGEPNIRFYAGCPIRDLNGNKMGTLCIIDQKPRVFEKEDIEILKDLAAMAESELAAIQMATIDELTNVSNRRGFMMLAQQTLNLCTRQKISAALVFLDLDKFKIINDTFGHAEGDRALIAFAEQLKSVYRDSDICGRLGGDEFVVLLTNSSKQLAEEVTEKLSQSLVKYNKKHNRGYDFEFSCGIVDFKPEKHESIENLLADGDLLMYEVKKAKG